MNWQPISSAPKDGTDILVLACIATVWVAHIAWWREKDELCGFADDDVGWWSYVRGSVTQEKLDGVYTPSHWMPLPPPPVDEKS